MTNSASPAVTGPAKVPAAANPSAEIRSTVAKQAQADAQSIASLAAKVITLEAMLAKGDKAEKKPVETSALAAAISALEADAKADLDKTNPRSTPNLSLSGILGFVPAMTKEQNALWKPARDAMRKAYSARHRTLVPQRKAALARVMRNPASLVATVLTVRKDKTVSRVSLSAKEPAKVRAGKGLKKAKPAQIAAKVPAAGNAAQPATVQ